MTKKTDKQILFERMHKVAGMSLNENEYTSDVENYLPDNLKQSEEAKKIVIKINELLDLINDPTIDQSEGGVSDKMRKMALHMINTNR